MNCIILLFLLGCCRGWGNGRNCRGCSGNACGCGARTDSGCGCGNGRNRDMAQRNFDRGDCGCGNPEPEDCGCRQEERECCDVPGMIPPPWQDYPPFPRRDNMERGNSEDCEG